MRYKIEFDRIGTNKKVPPIEIEADDQLEMADKVLEEVHSHLIQRPIAIQIDGTQGFIQWGRWGSFTVEALGE